MKKIDTFELQNIYGGSISAALLTGIVRGINSILDLGRSLGTAVRRIQSGQMCSI